MITMGPAGSDECRANLYQIIAICTELGVPLAADKLEGPSDCLIFLGIEIDTRAGQLHLPADKLARLRDLLAQWQPCRSCRHRQLEWLVGTLHHACCVMKPGRAFLQQIIDLLPLPGATQGHHHIRLNKEFRANLQWWDTFASHWNGVVMFPCMKKPAVSATSDASGSWGCGGWSGSSWFQLEWPPEACNWSILFKELLAGLVAAMIWGSRWKGNRVRWFCNNQPAVFTVNRRSCWDRQIMGLIRCLFFMEVWFSFEMVVSHLPGRDNVWPMICRITANLLFPPRLFDRTPLPVKGLKNILLQNASL